MVEPVTPISPTVSSSPTKIHTSTSIGSEPDNAWVAARQSVITAGLLKLKRTLGKEKSTDGSSDEEAGTETVSEHTLSDKRGEEASDDPLGIDEIPEHATFSGESERIGTSNFDEDTPLANVLLSSDKRLA